MSLIKQYLLQRLRELEEEEGMQPLSKEAYEALLQEWNDSLSKPLS